LIDLKTRRYLIKSNDNSSISENLPIQLDNINIEFKYALNSEMNINSLDNELIDFCLNNDLIYNICEIIEKSLHTRIAEFLNNGIYYQFVSNVSSTVIESEISNKDNKCIHTTYIISINDMSSNLFLLIFIRSSK
jgi:hypothetical protein